MENTRQQNKQCVFTVIVAYICSPVSFLKCVASNTTASLKVGQCSLCEEGANPSICSRPAGTVHMSDLHRFVSACEKIWKFLFEPSFQMSAKL